VLKKSLTLQRSNLRNHECNKKITKSVFLAFLADGEGQDAFCAVF
jgi:hypothetical protein